MTLLISLCPTTEKELEEQYLQAKLKKCPIELRLDKLANIPWEALHRLLPYMITPRGKSEEEVLRLASLRPPFMDLGSEFDPSFFCRVREHSPNTALIASYHSYDEGVVDLEKIYARLRALPCDGVKIAIQCKNSCEALHALQFLERKSTEFPLTLVCMGDNVSFTRILAPIFGSQFGYCCLPQKETAPGQLSIDEMVAYYDAKRLTTHTSCFALLGDPLHLSPSHITHNAIFREYAIDAVYVKIPLDEPHFKEAIASFQDLGFKGFSVTMPLKYAFSRHFEGKNIPYNTVSFAAEPAFSSTDGSAALDAIEQRGNVKGKTIGIIGAGATAVNIAEEAVKRGATVLFFNRTERPISFPLYPLEEIAIKGKECDVLINATSCGMKEGDALPIQSEWLNPSVIGLDVVIKDNTHFVQTIRACGGRAILGREMWVRQAAKQFVFWFPHLREERIRSSLQLTTIERPSFLRGSLAPPASKSHTLRSLLFAAFGKGRSTIYNLLPSPDTDATIAFGTALGARYERHGNDVIVDGIGEKRILSGPYNFYSGNSGILLRFGAAISSLFSGSMSWSGDASLQRQRPVQPLLDALSQLGVKVNSENGYAPFTVEGPLQAGDVEVSGEDSQPVSALLIAASLLNKKTRIHVKNAGERPYVDLTLEWLQRLGISIRREGYSFFEVEGRGFYEPFTYTVPADWSSALYPIALSLITPSEVEIRGLDFHDTQGDKAVLSVFEKMGAIFHKDEKNGTLVVRGPQKLSNISIDVNDTIDAIPLLAVVATYAEGTMHLYNGENARYKECDRIASSSFTLSKLGAHIEETEDGMIIHSSPLQADRLLGQPLPCNNDHRMCLSLACAASVATGATTLFGVDAIRKTYPDFFLEIQKLRGRIE